MNKVELEFKRIQTYLFASPRLRAMLGANAALGHTIRITLPKIAKDYGAIADPQTQKKMPVAVQEDPLMQEHDIDAVMVDNPASLYQNYGVLVRDGGHFIATFLEREQAQGFIARAIECITQELPGILLEARIDGEKPANISHGESLFQHPGFQVSHHLGNQPAESQGEGEKATFVSAQEKQMEKLGKNFRENAGDLIAMMEKKHLIPCPKEPPKSLDMIAGDDYLALVHADGNNIGQRYQAWRKPMAEQERGLEAEAYGERFYYSMRVAVRRALTETLCQVFKNAPERYQLLMLGGDDLLLICAASYALPFVRTYAEALRHINLCDNKPLSIGAGVAIAKHTFPFHRLQATAEALIDSAKRRYRANPALGSVVDWHVTSSAWVDDPIAERQSNSIAGNAVLSDKPYPILGERSLDTLLRQTESIGQSFDKIARSQLRNLVDVMRQGPSLAELSWRELPDPMRNTLQEVLKNFGQSELFHQPADGLRTSVVPDLVELYELIRRPERYSKERVA